MTQEQAATSAATDRPWIAVKDGHVVAQEATSKDLFVALDRLGIKGVICSKVRSADAK